MEKELKNEYHERNKRWSQILNNQLTFYNNLILSLSLGFLAFCFKPENFKNIEIAISEIEFPISSLVCSVILILLSIIIGLIISITRLKDFRITRQINQIRQRTYEHSNKLLDESSPEKYNFKKRFSMIFGKTPQITIEECKNYISTKEFNSRFRKMRNIAHNLGQNSWDFTKYQTTTFGLSVFFYILSILL